MNKILLLATAFLLTVPSPCHAGFFSKTHTATLILGQSRGEVLKQAEHILGEPTEITSAPADEEGGEFEWRYYDFTDQDNIVLIFYRDRFYQLIVEEKNPDDMPFITDMSDRLKGFLLAKRDNRIELKLLGLPRTEISPNMLTLKSLDIAWIKFRQKDYADAKMIALTVREKYPNNAEALNLLGNIDIRENKLESSIKHFKDALEIREGQEGRTDYILNNLAMTYFKAGQYDNAHQTFEESIAVASNLNCAGRIGDLLVLIRMDKKDMAEEVIKPCNTDSRGSKQALEKLLTHFEITDDSLKKTALGFL